MRLPAGTRTEHNAPSSFTNSFVVDNNLLAVLVASPILNQGMFPPKYFGSPAGRGEAPRRTEQRLPSRSSRQPSGRLGQLKVLTAPPNSDFKSYLRKATPNHIL